MDGTGKGCGEENGFGRGWVEGNTGFITKLNKDPSWL